jgi:hypothetical protein
MTHRQPDHLATPAKLLNLTLRDLVQALFHVRYAHASLKRLLKEEFDIVSTGARTTLAEGSNLAELQTRLALVKKRLERSDY